MTAVYVLIFWPSAKGKIPPLTDRLLLKPAIELADLIRKQEVTAEDVMQAYIKRIREVNPLINAIIDERFEAALNDARQLDQRIEQEMTGETNHSFPSIFNQTLLGVPFTIKDSFAVNGMRLCSGLPQRKEVRADCDSKAIINLKLAGAIPVAIGNVPEVSLSSGLQVFLFK